MGNGGNVFARRYGGEPNHLEDALALKRALRKISDSVPGPEPCIVDSFNFTKQRVDVRLKNYPELTVIYNVGIAGSGDTLAHYRSFKTIQVDGELRADTGWLVYFHSDSGSSFHKRGFTPRASTILWTGEHPIFIPTTMLLLNEVNLEPSIKDEDALSTEPDKLGPGDEALVHKPTGSHIIFKENGDIVLKAAGKLYLGDTSTVAASMKEIARKGDAVSVDTGTGLGTITAGSTKTRSA